MGLGAQGYHGSRCTLSHGSRVYMGAMGLGAHGYHGSRVHMGTMGLGAHGYHGSRCTRYHGSRSGVGKLFSPRATWDIRLVSRGLH